MKLYGLSSLLKNERSFLAAFFLFILVFSFRDQILYQNPLYIEVIIFIVIFSVIIYAAIGVVHHAELLAHKLGEPYGTMILTFSAVTVEVIMIATMMLHADSDPTLARDTIYATLMILINGLAGLIMLLGGIKYREQFYNLKSSNSFFSMIIAIVGLGLILPNFIPADSIIVFEIFLIFTSILLYIFFIRLQSKELHYFYSYTPEHSPAKEAFEEKKENINGWYHSLMMILTIVVISIIAEYLSVVVDDGIEQLDLPEKIAALIIAIIIVSPEGLTAIRAGLNNDMQRVINISLGSALSTVTLTIPAVLVVGLIYNKEVILGLTPVMAGMIIISILVGLLSTGRGESNALQGFIHLVLFITFIFLIFI
jgi:Ca2+:H+ antiporter